MTERLCDCFISLNMASEPCFKFKSYSINSVIFFCLMHHLKRCHELFPKPEELASATSFLFYLLSLLRSVSSPPSQACMIGISKCRPDTLFLRVACISFRRHAVLVVLPGVGGGFKDRVEREWKIKLRFDSCQVFSRVPP